jgi:predicted protein tyrosine phosphatase
MEFFVYSIQAIEAIHPHEEPNVIISIRTPGAPMARIRRGPQTRDILFMAFPDLDENYRALPAGEKRYNDGALFDEDDAKEILAFVDLHKNHIESIIVHCEGGMSRSPGVAAALSKLLTGDDTRFFKSKTPNMLVYSTLIKVGLGPMVG